jgi:hypothetical protein
MTGGALTPQRWRAVEVTVPVIEHPQMVELEPMPMLACPLSVVASMRDATLHRTSGFRVS